MANRCIDKVSIDVDAFRGLLKSNNMHVTGKNGLDKVLDREAKTIRRWLEAGEIPVSMIDDICKALKCKKEEFIMNTAVSLPGKNDDEATKIAMGYRWYVLEHHAEGLFAELAQFTEEEAKLFEKILNYTDDTVEFYDEGHSGFMTIRTDLGGFDTKKEAIKKWLSGVTNWDYDALIGYDKYATNEEWLDKFKEEEE